MSELELRDLLSQLRADMEEEQRRLAMVDALLVDRKGNERQGNEARVRACDEQLAYYGYRPGEAVASK